MPKIIAVENKFYIRIPGDTYYDNPYNRDSICYYFNLDKKTIKVERRAIGEDGFKVTQKTYSISSDEANMILRCFTMKNGFLLDYFDHYRVADGKKFSHSILSIGIEKIYFPDYLCNFRSMDLFKRYRYYPERERVLFYSAIRFILHFAFTKTEKPKKEFPTSTKSSLAFKIDVESISLE